MSRPSHNTDQRLIQAGKELLPQTGFAGLKLRQVAAKAKVNLGMFHYHFKNKREFVRRVLQQTYEEFFARFTLEISRGTSPGEQLKKGITTGARMVRDNRQLILGLVKDVMDEHQETIQFLKTNFHRHGVILLDILKQCQKSGVFDQKLSIFKVISVMAGATFAPLIAYGVLERMSRHIPIPFSLFKGLIASQVITDQAIEHRIELAMKALAPPKGKQPPTFPAAVLRESRGTKRRMA